MCIRDSRYTEDDVYSEVTNYYGREGTDILEIEGDKVTGRLVIEHDINETTMLFGSFTRGFKPGGSNLTYGTESVVAPIVVLPVFEEEVVEAFEVGLKTDLADGRVRLNAAAFYYDYSDLQYQATDPEVFNGGVGNIPESEIFGAELEFSAFLTDSLILDARMAWLDTEITSDHLALDNVQSEAAGNATESALLPGHAEPHSETHGEDHAHHHGVEGQGLSVLWVIPFAGMLLSIALGPILAPHFWHANYGKVAAGWIVLLSIPFLAIYKGDAFYEILHIVMLYYVPFIILLGALFTAA